MKKNTGDVLIMILKYISIIILIMLLYLCINGFAKNRNAEKEPEIPVNDLKAGGIWRNSLGVDIYP